MTSMQPHAGGHSTELSLIVNTFEKPRHLALVLQSIANQRGVRSDFEVIVADDGSRDETAAVVGSFAAAAQFPVRLVTAPHDGFRAAAVRNRGARAAAGRYLLFLDGDCILPRDHLAAHVERRRPGTTMLGNYARLSEAESASLVPGSLVAIDPATLAPREELRRLARRHRKAWWQGLLRHPTKPRLTSCNFGVWRTDFERINGFDERFVGWGQEDDDLGLRLRAAGVRLASILDRTFSLHVWHPTDPSQAKRWRDGPNVGYFSRRGRLTRCRRGLVDRPAAAIRWGLPDDLQATSSGRELARLLADAEQAPPGAPCEIDVVIRPGRAAFCRPAECRLLLVEEGHEVEARLGAKADRVTKIPSETSATLVEVLDAVG